VTHFSHVTLLVHRGAYLSNDTLWDVCEEPPHVVPWNVTLFSLLAIASSLEIVLCGVQLVNASIGVVCGDCRKKVGQMLGGVVEGTSLLLAASSLALFSAGHFSLTLHDCPITLNHSWTPAWPAHPLLAGINCLLLFLFINSSPFG
jgi:hypothetical protein